MMIDKVYCIYKQKIKKDKPKLYIPTILNANFITVLIITE